MQDAIKVFTGNANPGLAQAICEHLHIPLSEAQISRFSNENIFVHVCENVRERDVFVVQPLCSPVSESLVELLIMIDALKGASARRITAVVPYYSYARSDKKDMPRISIAGRLIADLLVTAGAHRLLTMTLHSEQVQGFFRCQADHLSATPILCGYFQQKLDLANCVALAADAGSARRAGAYATRLNIPLAFVDKRRYGDNKVEARAIVGDVKGKTILYFDDEIATGSSLLETIGVLQGFGIGDIYVGVTHGVLTGNAVKRIEESPIKEVVVTDTVPLPAEKQSPKIVQLSVAPLFAQAIERIHTGESVSSIFE
ncbi:MAG: ribose-phosphate pyrophosphokinase [Armatimonadetes bacterium]|nr:ribose-phosphate pyrophosphokinase [Armatimonadota bacterium]